MSKRQEFIDEVNKMIESLNYSWQSDDAKVYWEILNSQTEEEKPMFTDNGKLILKYLQENVSDSMWKARDIAEGLFIASRAVSGAMRKLVDDGFVEKVGQNPVIYSLTQKGKDVNIEEN